MKKNKDLHKEYIKYLKVQTKMYECMIFGGNKKENNEKK